MTFVNRPYRRNGAAGWYERCSTEASSMSVAPAGSSTTRRASTAAGPPGNFWIARSSAIGPNCSAMRCWPKNWGRNRYGSVCIFRSCTPGANGHRRIEAAVSARIAPQCAKSALATGVVLECAVEPLLAEVRPETVGEVQLRISAFPQQKIAEPLFAAGANQQIDLACGIQGMIDFVQQAPKRLTIKIRDVLGPPRSRNDAVLRRIVDRDAQVHSGSGGAQALALLDRAQQTLAEPIAPAADIEADRLLDRKSVVE